MDSIDRELEKYKISVEFAEDCESLKSECVIKEGCLPDDLTIEERVLAEKRKTLLTERECREKGHIFIKGDEEKVNGSVWVCCQRCGQWVMNEKGGENE